MSKSKDDLEREVVDLRESVRQEKLKKAEQSFGLTFVFTAIIFVIIFVFLMAKIEDESAGIQWLCIVVFGAVAMFTAGRIFNTYNREKNDAMKN